MRNINNSNKYILKTALTIICAFLITGVIVYAKNAYSCKLPADVGVKAVSDVKNIDYLFVGASSFRKGINMREVEKKLSDNAYMLTYNGNQPLNMDLEISEIYKSGANIKTLICEFDPGMISTHADLSDKRLLWDIGLDSKITLFKHLLKREDMDTFMMFDYFVSSNMDYLITYPLAKPVISKRYYKGGNTGEDEVKGLTAEELDALEVKEEAGFNELQKESLKHIIDLCRENNTNLIFLESPNYIKMYCDENYREKHELLKEFLEEENIRCITKDDLKFDYKNPSCYSDLSHMSSEGMNLYTKEIIEILN